jgi:hypothetical protein
MSAKVAITQEMIEAGVWALQRRGYGCEGGEPMSNLCQAVEEVFEAMMEAARLSRCAQEAK